jgi:glycosyltransferase involved in cell wall biosynthesis
MRILFASLIPSNWGGSEELWSQAAHVLLRRGHTVEAFFGYYKQNDRITALARAGCVMGYGTPPPARWWRRLGQRHLDPLARFEVSLAKGRPDLVVFSQSNLGEGIGHMLACRRRGMPYAIVNQLVEPWTTSASWAAACTAFRQARKVWFVSAENLESATAWLAVPLPQATVVVNPTSFAAASVPWPADDDGLRLACVGRLWPPQKGQDLLIDTLGAHAAQWRERRLRVTFFGNEEEASPLRARAKWRGCDCVDFAPTTTTPRDIWHRHHALVQPSRFEGQSLAMLEAMCMERPVLVTPVGGTRGLIRPGENGFLARSIDVPGVADLLETAWQARKDWPRIGRIAAQDARRWMGSDPGAAFATLVEDAAREYPGN